MGNTSIQWTDATWNPVRGCSIVSAGCANCYAMRQAHRFSGPGQPYEYLTKMTKSGPVWIGKVQLVPELLSQPLRWRKPRRVFVNSMSDLFHEDVPDDFIDRVWMVMTQARRHVFQILTKRPERMRKYLSRFRPDGEGWITRDGARAMGKPRSGPLIADNNWPPKNIWLGVSVERQREADERIPLLLQTPAAVRFVSLEPLLGPIQLTGISSSPACFNALLCGRYPRLDWVIIGGESGPGARPCDIAWIRDIVRQCKEAGVPVFVKQLGSHPTGTGRPWCDKHGFNDRKGGDLLEWPEDLRVREYPR